MVSVKHLKPSTSRVYSLTYNHERLTFSTRDVCLILQKIHRTSSYLLWANCVKNPVCQYGLVKHIDSRCNVLDQPIKPFEQSLPSVCTTSHNSPVSGFIHGIQVEHLKNKKMHFQVQWKYIKRLTWVRCRIYRP